MKKALFVIGLPVLPVLLLSLASGCATTGPVGDYDYNTPVSKVVFSCVDLETTGLDPKTDRIVEIGVVKFLDGRVLERKSWLVNPGMPIPKSAVRIHGITTEMVADSPGFAAVYPAFKEFIGRTVILAHNARYDIAFTDAELDRAGLPAPSNKMVDTLPVCREWFPEAKRFTLEAVMRHLGLEADEYHRALADSDSLQRIFKKGVRSQPSSMTLGDLVGVAGGELRFGGKAGR